MKLRMLALSMVLLVTATLALAQTWVPLTNPPNPNLGLSSPLLLTDGTVIFHVPCGRAWHKLTPDHLGSYVNGTWSQIASLPVGYAPLYFSSAVLPDGRVIVEGGEYNAASGGCADAWTNLGAIYDPKADQWTAMAPPAGWSNIGDAASVILADGTYMQANCCSKQAALLDAKSLTWTSTGKGKYDINNEEGWTLLPNGDVLTIDTYVAKYKTGGMNYEIYRPRSGSWISGPATGTVVQLWDSYPNYRYASYEMGPAVLRPDGTVFATGANGTPGESGHTAIYDTHTQTWTAGPDFPDGLDIADGPGALLPDGNVLVMTSPGIYQRNARFFEWNGSTLTDVTAGMSDAPNVSSYYGNMLVLPTGEIIVTDFFNVWIYQSAGTPDPAWLPEITSAPTTVHRNGSYKISGYNFNGFSLGAAYGDDEQAATNYPIVRLTNQSTGDVFYARTHDHSTMGIAYSEEASTTFDVSPKTVNGLYNLQVIANGIASPAVTVSVQ
ncbi:MAG: hypothetical protein ABSD39_12810 [Terriglobales bacterium]|jgi:hypothetical protein